MHDIGIWFLLLSLFVPRLTLFFWWVTGNLPYNTTPFIVDVFAAILVPRILVLVYIYGCMGANAWFWVHFGVLLVVYAFNSLRLYVKMNESK